MELNSSLDFYRVQDFTGSAPMLIRKDITLKLFIQSILQKTDHQHKNFNIFYHWKPLLIQNQGTLTLQQIVARDPMQQPIFFICDDVQQDEIKEEYHALYEELKQHLYVDDKQTKSYWYGANGHMLLDNRNLGLLASSIKKATNAQEFKKLHGEQKKDKIKQQLKQSLVMENQSSSQSQDQFIQDNKKLALKKQGSYVVNQTKQQQQKGESLLRKFLVKIGLAKKKPTSENLKATLKTLQNVKTEQDLAHPDYKYSDYDPKFVAYLQSVYIKFAIKSAFKLHYIEYKSWEFGLIKHKFNNKSKIGIIGDFGTGLTDSFKLLQHLIIQKKVDIIIHLGDVYYAGTPQQYENNITKPLNKYRSLVKREIIFYSIPGNHDYYSWGLPYLCFIKQINSNQFVRQQASYFCLRSQDDQWQFLGIDTAYHDSNPIDQLSVNSLGPRIRHKQLSWHRQKLNNFKGSSILLTHHQLFSIHDRICGSLSKYRIYSCINPLISSQLFEYMPYFSCWYWGHQHSFMLYADDILGVPRCRLLGNSSFHVVFQKQHPYKRKVGFPRIPFIVDDQDYIDRYVPKDPNSTQLYFNLTYGIIDMEKFNPKQGLKIEYICCPCFQEQDKDKPHFQPYLLYEQIINSRTQIMKKYKGLKNGSLLWLKMQTGLVVDYLIDLSISPTSKTQKFQNNKCDFNLIGKPFVLQRVAGESQFVRDGQAVYFKSLKEYYYLTLNQKTNKVFLTPQKTDSAIWILKKSYIPYDQGQETIKYRNTLKISHKNSDVNLSWNMNEGLIGNKGKIGEAVWMLLQKSLISKQ